MKPDLRSGVAAHQRPRHHAIAQAALACLLPWLAASAAHASTIYLPPCDNCVLGSGPAAGDEWVVQGKAVRAIGSFDIGGTLTNQANVLTNQAVLVVKGAQGRLINQKKLINDQAISLAHPQASLINHGVFQNNGTILSNAGLIDNVAGHFVNAGAIKAGDRLRNRNAASLTNLGDLDLGITGRLDNDQGAVLRNSGTLHGLVDAKISNHGTIRNLAGGVLSPDLIVNAGKIINEAGATMSQRLYVSEAGSALVNHGVINNDRDGAFTLAAGSDYDFTGGTFNNGLLSQLSLQRNFTFGAAKSGTVNLGAMGTVHNYAHAQVAANHTQLSEGGFVNDGQFTVHGAFVTKGMGRFINAQKATVTNNGTFQVHDEGATNDGVFLNKGTLILAGGAFDNRAGASMDNRGTVFLGGGKLANAGTLHNTGSIRIDSSNGYDFTGGTLVNGRNGALRFETAFTFGAEKSGNVVLGSGGNLTATAELANRAGHIQINAGTVSVAYAHFVNEKGATFVNNGNFNIAGHFTQAGTWIGSGTFEQGEGGMDLTGVMVQDQVKFGHNGVQTISKGGVLTANHLATGFTFVQLDGGTINSPNEVLMSDLRVHGDGGLINADVRIEGVQLSDANLIIHGNAVLGDLAQTGQSAVSSFLSLTTTQYGRIRATGNILIFGDFINRSSSVDWSTAHASLSLLGQGTHEIALAGQDLGASEAGLAAGNFAWQDVVFGEGGAWRLTDGNDTAGAALYARHLSFLGGLGQIKELSGDYNIYYDAAAAGNEIFEGKTYAFGHGSGKVIGIGIGIGIAAVPEPDALALALAGMGAIAVWRRWHALPKRR